MTACYSASSIVSVDRRGPNGEIEGVVTHPNGQSTPYRHTVGDELWTRVFRARLPDSALDYLDLLSAVRASDRLVRRHISVEGDGFRRRFIVRIPSLDRSFWSDCSVQAELTDLLRFHTDDEWEVNWVDFPSADWLPFAARQGALLEVAADVDSIILFSGGLYSPAGVCGTLIDKPDCRIGLVSVGTSTRIVSVQREVFKCVRNLYSNRVFPIEIPTDLNAETRRERDHRSRQLLFLSLGAVVASVMCIGELQQYENGLGALCLSPCSGAMEWQVPRSVRADSLLRLSEFLSTIYCVPVRINNPFVLGTKAEVCKLIPLAGLASAIPNTVSCDRYPRRRPDSKGCGWCSPDVLRRQALIVAGLGESDVSSRFEIDIWGTRPRPSTGALRPLRMMEHQVERFRRCLDSKLGNRAAFSIEFPELVFASEGIASQVVRNVDEVRQEVIGMLRRYVDEWDSLTATSLVDHARANARRTSETRQLTFKDLIGYG